MVKMLPMLLLLCTTFVQFSHGRSHLRHPFMRSAPLRCPIDSENTLRIQLFVRDEEECLNLCEETDGCHFYRWGM